MSTHSTYSNAEIAIICQFLLKVSASRINSCIRSLYIVVMGNPGLVLGPDLEVAVHNVAEPVTQPKTRLNTGRT